MSMDSWSIPGLSTTTTMKEQKFMQKIWESSEKEGKTLKSLNTSKSIGTALYLVES